MRRLAPEVLRGLWQSVASRRTIRDLLKGYLHHGLKHRRNRHFAEQLESATCKNGPLAHGKSHEAVRGIFSIQLYKQ